MFICPLTSGADSQLSSLTVDHFFVCFFVCCFSRQFLRVALAALESALRPGLPQTHKQCWSLALLPKCWD